MPVRVHVTDVFALPVTVAEKDFVPVVVTEALDGVMLSDTAAAAMIFTLADADFVGSAVLVARTVTAKGELTLLGGV